MDDKEQVNALSTKDLRNLFKLRSGTPSDTHDKLRCERCQIVADNADQDAKRVLPKQLAACKDLIEVMSAQEDAAAFLMPLKPEEHGVTPEDYDKVVKQPIDLGTIKAKLNADSSRSNSYNSPSAFSKDVNRIFTNVVKVWEPGQEIADAARRLQCWWMEQWAALVPRLMNMKPDSDKDDTNPEKDSNDEEGLSCAFVHNERGSDFQEQIGMPDEENMRHWSHHHSSDTVDDPVFRAAMRGYDAVSFVFGLEVTWSLIQQRQQEEEEKQAMLELECMQEIAEETEEDIKEEKTEEKTEEISDITQESNELECAIEKIEETPPEEIPEEIPEESDSMNVEDTVVEVESLDVEEDGDIKADFVEACEEKKEDEHEMHDLTSPTKKEEAPGDSNEQDFSSPDKKRTSSPCDDWTCVQCTYENKASAKKCTMCGKKKSSPKKLRL